MNLCFFVCSFLLHIIADINFLLTSPL